MSLDSEDLAARLNLGGSRRRHHQVDPLAAAVRLDMAAQAMHAAAATAGPPLEDPPAAETPAWEAFADGLEPAPTLEVTGAYARANANDPGEPPAPAPAQLEAPPAFSSERLNWASRHDDASRDYAVADHRLEGRAPLVDVLLPRGPILDQGSEGACVGFGTADAVNCLDLLQWKANGYAGKPADLLGDADARNLYLAAQKLDDVPGESYSGTSVLAGMKAAKAAGLIGGYLWAFGVRDVAQTIVQLRTPVVIGVPWFEGMEATDSAGVLGIAGAWAGGHCLAVVGFQGKGPTGQAGPYFIVQQSWGPTWGAGGLGYVHHRDLAWLLSQEGEAAVPQINL